MTWAFKQRLDPPRKIVLLALADFADDEWNCWPSLATLVDKTSLSERAVRSSIRTLEDLGLVATASRTRPNGSTTSNVYTLSGGGHDVPGEGARRAGGPSPETTPPEPSLNPQGKEPPVVPQVDHFEEAWKLWPKKTDKALARRRWATAVKAHAKDWECNAVQGVVDQPPIPVDKRESALANTVMRYGVEYQRTTPPQFIPSLATWLNRERWTDPLPRRADEGRHKPEDQPQPFHLPAGHRLVRDEMGRIIGTEPI